VSLFQSGNFTAHSDTILPFKIECDALSDDEIHLLAELALRLLSTTTFSSVIGIPRGGVRFADAVRSNVSITKTAPILLVDDVLTTGQSMEDAANSVESRIVFGIVIFARGPCPHWIKPIFSLNKQLW
jgi:hypoxanthine phosphoribosyltransferase